MSDPTKRDARLASLQPTTRAKFDKLLGFIEAETKSPHGPLSGVRIVVFETLRTNDRSDWLYASGRTRPGPVVTKAKGGSSYHNYGYAADLYPVDANGEPVWNFDQDPKLMAAMRRVAELAKLAGLEWGGNWKFTDLPHFQDLDAPVLQVLRVRYPHGYTPA